MKLRLRTIERITLITRFLGVWFMIYSTICFGLLEKYNLTDIGNNYAYILYWRYLWLVVLCFSADFVLQAIRMVNPVRKWIRASQIAVYCISCVLAVLILANLPDLICNGDRNSGMTMSLWSLENQIDSVRSCVMFDCSYICVRSLVYFVILVIGRRK